MYNFQCDFSPFQAGSFLDLSKKLKEKITEDKKIKTISSKTQVKAIANLRFCQ